MWNSTAIMAKAIGEGLVESGVEYKILPMGASHRSDVATEVLRSSAIIAGSPTLNNNVFPTIADVLTYIRGLRPINMIAASFGSYGWGGEAVAHINDYFKSMNIETVGEGVKVKYVPVEADLKSCFELGKTVGTVLKGRIK